MADKSGPKPGPRPQRWVKPTSPTRHVTVRIPEDDYAEIDNTANALGLTLSAYLRLSAKGTAVAEPEIREHVLTAAAGSAIPTPDLGPPLPE